MALCDNGAIVFFVPLFKPLAAPLGISYNEMLQKRSKS